VKTVLSDVWADLRDKRLWPLAALLVVALVAVPIVLAKPAEDPPAPDPAQRAQPEPEAPTPGALASVKLEDGVVAGGSSLDTFDPSDPFAPPTQVVEESTEESDAVADSGPGTDTGTSDTTVDDTVSVDVQEPTSGGGGGGTGNTGGGGDGGGGGGDEPTKTVEYTYVLDVTFVKNTRKRRIRGLEKLEMLPNEASPLLIYMGVTANAGNAVFMVDATLQTTGEGSCKPTGDDCAFLHLGAGSEQMFTDEEGNSYRLKVDQIRRVKVGGDGAAGSSKSKKKRPRASAAVGAPRRFVLPLLADLVTVSTGSADASGPREQGR
jgi:hypothetical protein